MKKLSLELDALKVESFGTTLPAAGRGTVVGADSKQIIPDTGDTGGDSLGEDSCRSCISCGGPTDPCLCDPF